MDLPDGSEGSFDSKEKDCLTSSHRVLIGHVVPSR